MFMPENIVVLGFTRFLTVFCWFSFMLICAWGVHVLGRRVRRIYGAKTLSLTGLWTWFIVALTQATLLNATIQWLIIRERIDIRADTDMVNMIGMHASFLVLLIMPVLMIVVIKADEAAA